jgi:uncharacterized protein YbaP (TraB family)
MYLWSFEYNGKKSYLIPTYHININLLFTNSEIQILENIIKNTDVVFFESNPQKPNKKAKTQIKDIYTSNDIITITKNINKEFKLHLEPKTIESKSIMQLTPGPGIGLLTCNFENGMDKMLNKIAKDSKKTIIYLDKGKEYTLTMKNLANQVDKIKTYLAAHPFSLKDINKNIKLTKKSIIEYRKLYTKTKINKMTQKNTVNTDKSLLDNRNFNWIPQINKIIKQNKSVVITVGSNHIDILYKNNIIDLLRKQNINIQKIKL